MGRIPFDKTTRNIDPVKAESTALTGVENLCFPNIRQWIRDFLSDESEVRLIHT